MNDVVTAERKEFEMSDADFQNLKEACTPEPVVMIAGIVPLSPQEKANLVWSDLGKKMGFDWQTARPVGGAGQHKRFTAVPINRLSEGDELTPDTFADFVSRLKYHCRGDGVQDHCTADAIFIVQARRIISGIDKDYTDKLMAAFDEQQWFSPQEYWDDLDDEGKRRLNAKVKESHEDKTFLKLDESAQWEILGELDDHTVTGWDEDWEYVNAHFTREAADAFIERKKHDYRAGLRVYVDSQYWCWEFKAIVNALMDGRLVLASPPVEVRGDLVASGVLGEMG